MKRVSLHRNFKLHKKIWTNFLWIQMSFWDFLIKSIYSSYEFHTRIAKKNLSIYYKIKNVASYLVLFELQIMDISSTGQISYELNLKLIIISLLFDEKSKFGYIFSHQFHLISHKFPLANEFKEVKRPTKKATSMTIIWKTPLSTHKRYFKTIPQNTKVLNFTPY